MEYYSVIIVLLSIILVQIYIYYLNKRQKENLKKEYNKFKNINYKDHPKVYIQYLDKLIRNPYLDKNKSNYIDLCMGQFSQNENKEIKDLKQLWRDKKKAKSRYQGPDGVA